MKKFLVLLFVLVLTISCNPIEYAVDEYVDYTVTFTPYVMEPMTKATTALTTAADYLDIYLKEGDNVTEYHQYKTDAGFASLRVKLNKTKTYTIYVFAHKGNGATSYENGIVSFVDNKVADTFYYTTTFSPATTSSTNCVLTRIVGQFRFETTDVIPNNVTQMKFTTYGVGSAFNVTNSTSANPIDKVTNYKNFSREPNGTASFLVTLLPNDTVNTSNFTIKVEALDSEDNVIETKTFTNVPIKSTYKTSYKGSFFITGDFTASMTAETGWNEFDETSF